MSPEEVQEIRESEEDLKTRVIFAREEMKDIRFKRSQSVYLCEEVSESSSEKSILEFVSKGRYNNALSMIVIGCPCWL